MDAATRRRRWRRRGWVYGGLLGAFWAFWVWQPWEFDLIERVPETPLALLDASAVPLLEKGTRVMVVTGHPDDAEFYLGGLLVLMHAAGVEVQLVVMTDGDKGYYLFEDWRENRRVRRAEQAKATARWSSHPPVFLGFPDGRLRSGEREEKSLFQAAQKFQPQIVLGFDADYPPRMSHRDHRRAGELSERVARKMRTPWFMRYSTVAPNYVVDVTNQWEEHKSLVAEHKSQFYGERLERVQNMIASTLETHGERIDAALGIGLRASRTDK